MADDEVCGICHDGADNEMIENHGCCVVFSHKTCLMAWQKVSNGGECYYCRCEIVNRFWMVRLNIDDIESIIEKKGGKHLLQNYAIDENDIEIYKKIVSIDGILIGYCPLSIKNNVEIVKIAVNQYPYSIKFCTAVIQNNLEIALAVVSRCGMIIQDFPDTIKNNVDIAIAAVSENPNAVFYCNDKIKNCKRVAMAAVTRDGFTLGYFSDKIKNNKKIVIAAIKQNENAAMYCSKELIYDMNFAMTVVKISASAVIKLSAKYAYDMEIAIEAIKYNKESIKLFAKLIQNDEKIKAILNCK
jgi:hypothetical protein